MDVFADDNSNLYLKELTVVEILQAALTQLRQKVIAVIVSVPVAES